MITPLLRRTAIAALFALAILPVAHGGGQARPATASAEEPQTAANTEAPPKPKLLRAAELAMFEVQDVLESSPHIGRNLDRLVGFQFTPATARLLEAAIGSAQPMQLERLGKRDGQDAWRLMMPARQHAPGDGSSVGWSESPTELRVDKSGRRLISTGTWERFDMQDEGMRIALRDMRTSTDQRMGQGKLWFGTLQFGVKHMEFDLQAPGQQGQPLTLMMDGLDFSGRTIEHATTFDIVHRTRIASIGVAGEQLSNLIMNYRLNQVDKKTAIEIAARSRKTALQESGNDEKAELLAMLRDLARASNKAGTALTIERISADYGGHTFTLQGRLALKGAKESDFDDLAQLFKRFDATYDIAVPVALIKAGALSASKRRMAAAGSTAQDPVLMAQTMTDAVVGKLLGEGFAKLDKGVLRATITARGGKVRVNGKEVSLPTPPQQ